MIALIEFILVAMTDAQFDKVLVMIGDLFKSLGEGVKAVWEIISPLVTALVAILIVYYQRKSEAARVKDQEEAKLARKVIVEKIDNTTEKINSETEKSQADRTKIITDLGENTKLSTQAFEAANGHKENIANAMQVSARIAELASKVITSNSPIDVHVTNNAQDPVPTTNTNNETK